MVQASVNNDTTPFIIKAFDSFRQDMATILQDAGRGAVALVQYTLMAQVLASGKWVPYTDVAAVDGSAIPSGIYMGGDIAGADLVAGDVVDVPILTFGSWFDEDKLVLENSLTLATIFATGTIHAKTVREILLEKSLLAVTTQSYSNFENA